MIWFDYDIERCCISCSSLRIASGLFQEKTSFHDYNRRSLFLTTGSVPARRLSRECRSLPAIPESESGQFTPYLILQAELWIQVRIKVISWIRIRTNLQMTSQNVWNKRLFEHLSKVLSLYLEARIRVGIHIKVKGRILIRFRNEVKIRIRIRIKWQPGSGTPDPSQSDADPQHCLQELREGRGSL
jgi:hypothetical protein